MAVNDTNKPAFPTWSHENLARFASEAYDRMVEQQETIEGQRLDLKTALQEIRALMVQQKDYT